MDIKYSVKLTGVDKVTRWLKDVEEGIQDEGVAKEVGITFADFVKARLRPHSKSGRLASGFGYITIEGPDVAPADEAIMEFRRTGEGWIEEVGVQNEYAVYFEEGFPPYEYTQEHPMAFSPTKKVREMYTSERTGGLVFATEIHHPGYRGAFIVRDAAQDFEGQFIEIMQAKLAGLVNI